MIRRSLNKPHFFIGSRTTTSEFSETMLFYISVVDKYDSTIICFMVMKIKVPIQKRVITPSCYYPIIKSI